MQNKLKNAENGAENLRIKFPQTIEKCRCVCYNTTCVTATKICDEAGGCLRYVREFPQSMSDFKPGGCNTEHSLVSQTVGLYP